MWTAGSSALCITGALPQPRRPWLLPVADLCPPPTQRAVVFGGNVGRENKAGVPQILRNAGARFPGSPPEKWLLLDVSGACGTATAAASCPAGASRQGRGGEGRGEDPPVPPRTLWLSGAPFQERGVLPESFLSCSLRGSEVRPGSQDERRRRKATHPGSCRHPSGSVPLPRPPAVVGCSESSGALSAFRPELFAAVRGGAACGGPSPSCWHQSRFVFSFQKERGKGKGEPGR